MKIMHLILTNELLLSRHHRLIRNWVCGWRKSLVVRPAYGESEVGVPVVSAIPSRRVLEEPHAAKKRRNGGWKGARREGAPEKEERILSCRGDCRVGTRRSVRPRPLSETRPEDRSSRAIASSCLREEPKRKHLPLRRIKRRVFRVCARIPEDLLHQSSRESRLIVNVGNLRWTILCIVFDSIIFKETKLSVRINDVIN